jgi:hypothetical protein
MTAMEKKVTDLSASVTKKLLFLKKSQYIYISGCIMSQTHMWRYKNNGCVV